VGGVEVAGRSGGGDPKDNCTCPPGGDPHDVDVDMAVGANASSLDPKAARIMPKAVAFMWEVHRLW
jgi:hypothetical protein